jgi:diketogulonate reductase-like aldo/keto reductase
VDIAEVAMRYILQKPMAAGIIVGARNTDHLNKLKRLSSFELDDYDQNRIHNLISKAKGPLGPFYELERDKNGSHGAIMKYNLNTGDS